MKYQKNMYKKVYIKDDAVVDINNIASGVYAPLNGFLREKDYKNVIKDMRLSDGTIWPMPIVLDIGYDDYDKIKDQEKIALHNENDVLIAYLNNIEIYKYDKDEFALSVYGTNEHEHPGVRVAHVMKDFLVGGDIEIVYNFQEEYHEHQYTPAKCKEIFKEQGWEKVVAFQTRNVPHLGHEYLQMKALEQVDGLLVHPVIGKKKAGDFRDEVILASYKILIEEYYPQNKCLLSALNLRMRYAGPKEALFHALIRKNFGCTHFIVGRDHAGVGNYYEPYAAQEIFNQFDKDELGIEIMKFEEVVYDNKRKEYCFQSECSDENKVLFSGTKLRTSIKNKDNNFSDLVRPKVYEYLIKSTVSPFIEQQHIENNKEGFVLWYTGLSGSGKSTIANKVYRRLRQEGLSIQRLDGDVVRESLCNDLTFSKADRDTNIRRIGFVANLLAQNGVNVTSSFITPYEKQRNDLDDRIKNLIVVYVNAPLAVCEERDVKGLYAKARAGEIKNFTGISDKYEAPVNPDIELKTDQLSVEESVEKVIEYLKRNHYIA